MEKIKIVRMITRMNIGGPAIQVSLLSSSLNKDMFSTTLITGQVTNDEGDMTYLAGEYKVEPLIISRLHREIDIVNDFINFWKLYKFLKREKPDIIHTHSSKVGMIGRIAARLVGVPVVIHTFHGHVFHDYFNPLKTKFFILIERVLAKITDTIVAISESQKDEIRKYLRLNNGDKVTVIPLGFDLDKFLKISQEDRGDELREELGIPKEAIVVGAIGRLTAIKNRRMFLKAAKEIKSRNPGKKIKFLLLGEGELKKELMNLTDRLGIQENVIFTGWREYRDMDVVYKAMDIVTITSLNEGTPVSLIEASASAKPVVATNVGGVSSIVEDGETGFIVPSNDVNAFSEAVSVLINDGEKRNRFGLYGRDFIRNRYSKDRLIKDVENLYYRELRKKEGEFDAGFNNRRRWFYRFSSGREITVAKK